MKKTIIFLVLCIATFVGFGCDGTTITPGGTGSGGESGGHYLPDDENTYVFGTYPQSLVKDETIITALKSLTNTNTNGYYEYENKEYAKVIATPYHEEALTSDGTAFETGETYYFLVEPIKWQILSDIEGKLLLTSKYILTNQPFTTPYYEEESNDWKESTIRVWLNDTFYNKAFTTEEQNAILTTQLNNTEDGYPWTSHNVWSDWEVYTFINEPYEYENTEDKIYLLAYKDIINTQYGYNAEPEIADPKRTTKPTDYAIASGAYSSLAEEYLGVGTYWLRSPHHCSTAAFIVYVEGYGLNEVILGNPAIGVRPTLRINK